MEDTKANIKVIRRDFADAIKQSGSKFYYENADMPPARFEFDTWEEAAADLAIEIGVTDGERKSVK